MRPELTPLPAELLGPKRDGASELPAREEGPLVAREIGAEAAAVRAAAAREAEVALGLDVAVLAPPASIDGRLVGTGRRPALAADGVCGFAEAVEAEPIGLVVVRTALELDAGVALELGVPAGLADGLTGERTGLTGEPMRVAAADALAAVGGLDADADEEAALATLVELVRLTAAGGAEGAKLARDVAALAGVGATLLRGLRRPAEVAERVAVAAGRVVREAGVGGGRMGSSSTLCISSSGDRTWT